MDNNFDKNLCHVYQGFMLSNLKIRPILYLWGGNSDTTIVTQASSVVFFLFLIHYSTGKQTWPQHIVYNF